jgi:hypothetical protein
MAERVIIADINISYQELCREEKMEKESAFINWKQGDRILFVKIP